jgi:5-(carboxyamino)imidazole ribonucleotide mutase
MSSKKIQVGVLIGSKSDEPKIKKCLDALADLGISYELNVMSAHRTPNKVAAYAGRAQSRGIKVLIAGAGLSAALPGVVASHTNLPVIGIPIASSALNGADALYSIAQMPPGIPVACMGIDSGKNAAIMAARILALEDKKIQSGLAKLKKDFGDISGH